MSVDLVIQIICQVLLVFLQSNSKIRIILLAVRTEREEFAISLRGHTLNQFRKAIIKVFPEVVVSTQQVHCVSTELLQN